ncbi:Calx-beta domain-containing protein, partial [Lyngbya sp. CCY1209]|uniref:Calx-beta domain-containing protein n=1 Tax=Lyngbya sp. CCY1209 TaxID=2886103 RepID=UPI002D2162BB
INVPILGDSQLERNEKFQVKLSNPTNAKLKDKVGIGIIINDDEPQPKISVSDTQIVEGNKGRKNAKFTVTLDAQTDETVQVNYATADKTAQANRDYKRTEGTLTFKPGQTRKTITVPILGDNKVESDETFNLNLSQPHNAQLKDRRGIGTIRDNDFAEIEIKNTQITEGDDRNKQAKFTVTLNEKVNERVRVNYATADGTAKAGEDYRRTQGQLTFKPNQVKKTVIVPIFGDTLDEEKEKFTVILSRPKNAKLGDQRAIGTIKDNDEGGDKPGDSFQTAINLGKLTKEEVMVDEIGFTEAGDRDTNHFYRFRTNKEGTFVLTLDDLFKDANVDLYGSDEELIAQSKNDGTKRERIETVLDPGSYYVRVYPQGSDRTPYRLSVDLI